MQAQNQSQEIPLEDYREVDLRRSDFILFLDGELSKIEAFYKEQEDEATERLRVLRGQLHIMRDRRLQEIDNRSATDRNNGHRHLSTIAHVGQDKIGKTSHSMVQLGTPLMPADNARIERNGLAGEDYERTPVKYQTAKSMLKHALHELYRALGLLKSYSTVNETAFRKIIKKYNKTVKSLGEPATNYMNERVRTAGFVTSNSAGDLMQYIEGQQAQFLIRGKWLD
jgi:SPX domain protein involved in polyphosphate accumulation